jgi:hypothetical protein
MAFGCGVMEDINDKHQSLYEAEKLLEFIYAKTPCKAKRIEKNQQDYLNEIMACLDNKEVFNALSKALVIDNSLSHKAELTPSERGLLLSLCIYQYCKDTHLYWSKVSDAIGPFPDLNIFFDAVNPSPQGDSGYATYPISKNETLVLQLVGRGNKNHSYFLWHVKIEDGKFKAILLNIPRYVDNSQSYQMNSEFLAKRCFYDSDNKHFVIHVNVGDVNGWKEEENTYQMEDGKLTLIKSCICTKECKTSFPNDIQKSKECFLILNPNEGLYSPRA